MSAHAFFPDLFARTPLIGIVRNLSMADLRAVLPLYADAGLTTIEITMNTPDADAMIRHARAHHPDGLNVGAGTVCTTADLERALAAGAQFIVTPILNKAVIQSCVRRGIPIMPGAFTPSEIYEAWSLGASLVKVFPATSLGPAYIRDVKAPLEQIKLLPTGGITLANLTDFLGAGADGAGVGSQLFDKTLIRAQNWTALSAHFRAFANCATATAQPT